MPPDRAHPSTFRLLLVPLGAGLALASCVPEAPSPAGPDGPFSLTLAWDPPVTDAEGGALQDLAGYRLYFGTRSPVGRGRGSMIEVGDVTSFTIGDLAAGRWYFAVSAVDESGNESELSDEISAEVGAP